MLPILLMAAGMFHVQTSQSVAATNDINSPLHLQLDKPETSAQPRGIGHGFSGQTSSLSLEAGAGVGFRILGSQGNHDSALMSLAYGHMLGGVRGQGWCRGNLELRGELFGGSQFYPEADWLAGVAAHLRYNFATGTR
ncbi:MAG TPA: hypothetical protein VN673_02685, partial [Clostridia bacterium]|nr:hypothetical protein [Clostridia bacterium]